MLKELRLDAAAPWKRRFRASSILWTHLARRAPHRGLAASNLSGVYQLYAWHVPSGALTQLTDRPEGLLFGALSPDGRFVYYLDDRGGNEIGHLAMSNRSGFGRPLISDPRTGERTDLPLDALSGEIETVDWSPDGGRVLLCQPQRAVQRVSRWNVTTMRLLAE